MITFDPPDYFPGFISLLLSQGKFLREDFESEVKTKILINREPLSNHQFDVELLGECDVIVEYLCKELGWNVDMDDANVESVPEETPIKDNLKQVDLLVPMKAALEDLAIQPDHSSAPAVTSISGESADQTVEKPPSIDKQETVSTPFTPGDKGITDADAKDTAMETPVADANTTGKVEGMEAKEIPVKAHTSTETPGSEAHNVLVEEANEEQEQQRPEGTAGCPIDADKEGSDSYWDECDYDEGEELDRKIVQLAKYLPENTFTRIPRRLYLFKGSELAISPEMIVEYVRVHSKQNGVSNGSIPDSPISDCSSSESSEIGEDSGDLIACILQRCRNDPILEAERKRCLEEEVDVEVIDCDESPSQTDTADTAVAATDSENRPTCNLLNRNCKKRMSSESPCDGSTESKRRKTCEDGKGEEKSNTCPTEVVDIMSDSDPYEVRRVLMPSFTSKEEPNLVASTSNTRLIGCLCEPEADVINWMELSKGKPAKCYCGHWFKLIDFEEYLASSTRS
nr:NAD dependent deacetylase sirtuin 1 [Hymenolepis microstoma]